MTDEYQGYVLTSYDNPSLNLPTTTAEAREMAETAVRFGVAAIVFGLVLRALLPKSQPPKVLDGCMPSQSKLTIF